VTRRGRAEISTSSRRRSVVRRAAAQDSLLGWFKVRQIPQLFCIKDAIVMPRSNGQVEVLVRSRWRRERTQSARCSSPTTFCSSSREAHRKHTVRDSMRTLGEELCSFILMQMAESLNVSAFVTECARERSAGSAGSSVWGAPVTDNEDRSSSSKCELRRVRQT